MIQRFLAIDFETANYHSDSACSIGLVRVEKQKIVAKEYHLIRPPYRHFNFTHIHGLTWKDVENEPDFAEIWPKISGMFDGVDFVAAHNVGFDRRVLHACCTRFEIDLPEMNYFCTVQLARRKLGISPANLPSVCSVLNIPLNHHDAMSDALACAKIVLAGLEQGQVLPSEESKAKAKRPRSSPSKSLLSPQP